jgi:hypothetical protein
MEQLNKYCIIFLLFFTWAKAQTIKSFFITKDTLTIENPIVVSIKNIDGMFLTDEKYIKDRKKIDIKKMLDKGTAYIFNDEFYRFLSKEELQNKIIYNECSYITQKENYKKFSIKKLDENVKHFLLCFVKIDFYNEKIITFDNGKTLFHKKHSDVFYIIAFPICDNGSN